MAGEEGSFAVCQLSVLLGIHYVRMCQCQLLQALQHRINTHATLNASL